MPLTGSEITNPPPATAVTPFDPASPGPIGGTVASAASFTDVQVNSILIGGGSTPIGKILTGSITTPTDAISGGSYFTFDITVNGAAEGDFGIVNLSLNSGDIVHDGLVLAQPPKVGTSKVSVTIYNTGLTPQALNARTAYAMVIHTV